MKRSRNQTHQKLFAALRLRDRLRACFSHLGAAPIFGHHIIVLLLVVHLRLGYRELRDVRFYCDDPLIKRLLDLRRLPDVATISRALASIDGPAIDRFRSLCRRLCLDRLLALRLRRVTLDFDGSVQSTSRRAEGTAVGFNKKKRGARSYSPCSARSPRRARSSMSSTARATSTTRAAP